MRTLAWQSRGSSESLYRGGRRCPPDLRPHSFLSLLRERKESPRRQKKPAPFRFRRGGENSISAAFFFLSESRPLRWVAFRLILEKKENVRNREHSRPIHRLVGPTTLSARRAVRSRRRVSRFGCAVRRADRVVRPYKPYPHAILMMVGRQHFTDTQQKMLPTCFGGKDPPALICASESELLFHPYTAANTSGS